MENEIITDEAKGLPLFERKDARVVLLGDIHGGWERLFKKIDHFGLGGCIIIQVGDLGAGFYGGYEKDFPELNKKFRLRNIELIAIRGNHDNPIYFDGSVNLSNFKLLPDYSVLNINGEIWQLAGGGISVDRKGHHHDGTRIRWEGHGYWKDEVFVFDKAKAVKCDVLVTHTGPPWIGPGLKGAFIEGLMDGDVHLKSELIEERRLLQELYDICRPKKAYLGHFHRHEVHTYHGDGYTCATRIVDEDELLEHR